MSDSPRTIHWLHYAGQRLGLLPGLGGAVAAWQLERAGEVIDLWRPWDGASMDMYTMASFAMLPWSNRISQGGFEQDGHFYPMRPNRAGEPYPIHGDGWLQPWALRQPAADTLEMSLTARQFDGNPYCYQALQRFVLRQDGLDQTVSVTHQGEQPLPYGLGLHPWFLRTPGTRLHAQVGGVWLSGNDPLPVAHSSDFPAGWDPRQGLDVNGSLVDNAYTGWSGEARITWPERQLQLDMCVPAVLESGENNGFCLLYRPPAGPSFCFEPVTHPIDAFHVPGNPGLRVLQAGETLSLHVEWRVRA